jgi:hypothetical protein
MVSLSILLCPFNEIGLFVRLVFFPIFSPHFFCLSPPILLTGFLKSAHRLRIYLGSSLLLLATPSAPDEDQCLPNVAHTEVWGVSSFVVSKATQATSNRQTIVASKLLSKRSRSSLSSTAVARMDSAGMKIRFTKPPVSNGTLRKFTHT